MGKQFNFRLFFSQSNGVYLTLSFRFMAHSWAQAFYDLQLLNVPAGFTSSVG